MDPVAWCWVLVEAGGFFQCHVDLDLGGLPGPVRQTPGRDQPPAALIAEMHRDPGHTHRQNASQRRRGQQG
jgi:hypothetical protein